MSGAQIAVPENCSSREGVWKRAPLALASPSRENFASPQRARANHVPLVTWKSDESHPERFLAERGAFEQYSRAIIGLTNNHVNLYLGVHVRLIDLRASAYDKNLWPAPGTPD